MNYKTSCKDWAKKLKNKQSIVPKPLFKETGEEALAIFKRLKVTDIAGQPTFGEVSDQWVFDFVLAVFGFYNVETGEQYISEYFLSVSKKNTKSTIAAGIMLTALILNWRHDEEFLIIAPTKEVADNSFKPASAMIRADEHLQEILQPRDHLRTIEHKITKASLKVASAENDTLSGKKAGWILIDELWVFGTKAKADGMLMEAMGGQVSRKEGRTIYLTTQSDEAPAGVFKEKLNYFRKVRDGEIEDKKALPIIYEFPQSMIKDKSYLKSENLYITNPNIGRSVNEEWILRELTKTQDATDSTKQKFLAKHLNIEIDFSLQDNSWVGGEYWRGAVDSNINIDTILEESEVVTIGIDGGGLDDLLGLYILGRTKHNTWIGTAYAWVTRKALQRRMKIAPRLNDFALDGDLFVVDDVGEDLNELVNIVKKVNDSFLLDKVGCDPAGIGDILDKLEEVGVEKDAIVGISQGWRLGGAIKTAERRLADGTFKTADQPLMSWSVSNAKVEQRANGILITKQASGFAKIDPLIAMFGAVQLMALNPESKGGLSFLSSPIFG